MIKYLFLKLAIFQIFYFATTVSLVAQDTIPEFCPKGARWIYDSFSVTFTTPPDDYTPYIELVYDRDTMVDGLKAKVLEETSYQIDTVEFYRNLIIRQEGWKIYRYADSAFRLVYDYGLEVGDSYELYVDPWYYDPTPSFIMTVPIDSVGEVTINNETMRAYHTSGEKYDYSYSFTGWNYFKTGNLVYFLEFEELFCDGTECAYFLRCYEDSSFFYSRRDYPCDALFSTSVRDKSGATPVKIFPNPVSDFLQIEMEKGTTRWRQWSIFNMLGILLKGSKELDDLIYVGDLPSGFYLLQLDDGWRKVAMPFSKR